MSKNKKEPIIQLFDLTRWKEIPVLIMKGFLMGSADIVPGVSGGTMALITGIYDRLIFAIKSFDYQAVRYAFTLKIKKLFEKVHWRFFLFLGTGMVLAIFFFTRIVPLQVYMYTHAELIYGLFFGLIVGSIFVLIAEIENENRSWKHLLPLIAGTLFGFWVVNLVPADTPENFWFIFLTGSIAISAMVLPGISGSYILLIFRKYDYILSELSLLGTSETFSALINLIPFILGALTGLIIFSRVLSWLLKNYHAFTIMLLVGFLVGSLWVIWPYQEREYVEMVKSTERIALNDPEVQQILDGDEIIDGKEYQRIGTNLEEVDLSDGTMLVEVETVSRQLISSKPYNPWSDEPRVIENEKKRDGVLGIITGVFIIGLIVFLRYRSKTSFSQST